MTARVSVMTGGSASFQTTAEDLNGLATDFISDGIVGAVTATSGVAPTTGGLSVNAQGTPDRTTAIGAGTAYVTATPTSQSSQRLRVKIDAQNKTHTTNTSGSTRYDWIYVVVSASLAANPLVTGDTTGTIEISRSTSSSVDNGTPPTYGYHIATVTLTNGYTTIVNGNIADTRVQAGTSAPASALGTSAITLGYAQITTSQSGITAAVDLTNLSVTVTVPSGGRRIKITGYFPGITSTTTTDRADSAIKEGSTTLNSSFATTGASGCTVTLVAVTTPTAGSHTYKLNLGRTGAGTMTLYSDATLAQAFILVEAI